MLQCLLDTTNVAGALGGRMARVPVVVAGLRSLHPEERGDIAHPFQRYCYRLLQRSLVDAVIANSVAGRDSFLSRTKRFDEEKLRVVHNGIEPPRAPSKPPAALRDELGADDAPVILCAGRLAPEKRLDVILRACAHLAAAGVPFQMWIVGSGRERARLEDQIRELSLAQQVKLLGNRTDISDLLAAARVVVLASDVEGFPNAILEAQAAGIAVVATNAGGVPEIIEDGETGFVVNKGDHHALADRLMILLRDADGAAAMGRAAAVRAAQLFGTDRMASETLAVYRWAAKRRGITLARIDDALKNS